MSPSYKDDFGVVHYSNPSLGIEEKTFSPLCHFFPDDARIRVSDGNRMGWHVGWMDEIIGSPRYELVLWDGETGISGIHKSRL